MGQEISGSNQNMKNLIENDAILESLIFLCRLSKSLANISKNRNKNVNFLIDG